MKHFLVSKMNSIESTMFLYYDDHNQASSFRHDFDHVIVMNVHSFHNNYQISGLKYSRNILVMIYSIDEMWSKQ